jgi:hypothetical protein
MVCCFETGRHSLARAGASIGHKQTEVRASTGATTIDSQEMSESCSANLASDLTMDEANESTEYICTPCGILPAR